MKKYSFRIIYQFFVLSWFSFTGLFNGIFVFFVATSLKIAIDTVLTLGLIIFNRNARKISLYQFLFIVFYMFITLSSLLLFFRYNHYGFEKLLKNVILTWLTLLDYFILYINFRDTSFSKGIVRIFLVQIFVECFLFFLYILYNKNSGLISQSYIQGFIFQDFVGRFQGSFSEPSFLGFWLGCVICVLSLIFRRKIKYVSAALLIVILYWACKAKFALLAFPGAIICAVCVPRRFFSKYNLEIFFSLICFCLLSLFWKNVSESFFICLSHLIPRKASATYVTRFAFLLSSLQNICFYPIGHGFGLNYEVFQNIFTDIAPIAKNVNLEIFELLSYRLDPNNMGSKDTLSLIISSCGFLGIILYLQYFKKLLCDKYRYPFASLTLILFIFFESIITGNIFSNSSFFIVLFAKMALNSNKIEDKNNE